MPTSSSAPTQPGGQQSLSELEYLLERFLAAHPEDATRLLRTVVQNLSVQPLDRLEAVWDLSSSRAAELFGVSRQAYAKWRVVGVPADRRIDVDNVDAATQKLLTYLQPERIPSVVRRPAEKLNGKSLLDIAMTSESDSLRNAVDKLFDLQSVQP